MKSTTVQIHIFQLISILFFIYFLYDLYSRSVVDALLDTITMWATIVVTTPIPSVSILLGLPLKLFFNLSIYITYIFIACLSIFILFNFDHNSSFVKRILQTKTYSIFIISILSSTILTKLLDSGIDYFTEHKPMQHTLVMIIASSVLLGLYAYRLKTF